MACLQARIQKTHCGTRVSVDSGASVEKLVPIVAADETNVSPDIPIPDFKVVVFHCITVINTLYKKMIIFLGYSIKVRSNGSSGVKAAQVTRCSGFKSKVAFCLIMVTYFCALIFYQRWR